MIVLAIVSVVLFALLSISLYFNYRLLTIVFRMEDSIGDCLDELNKAYGRIGRVLDFPVGSDDPFVQDVVDSLKMAQRAVLMVANKMVDGWKQIDERSQESSSEKKSS